MNNPKVKKAIKLQEKANQEIDMQGQTSNATFDKLMKVFDSLTAIEIELVVAATTGFIDSDSMFDNEDEF